MTTDAVGGVWTYSLDLAAVLGRLGVQTTLAELGPGPTRDQLEAARAITGLDLIQLELPLDWTAQNSAELRRTAQAVADLARRVRADVVHLNSPTLAAYADFGAPVVGA
ncbi:MAG TPA: glycosyltransferase, partial [Caulobacteraceae bacterium]|nr:glycosyltransferase [Caulobacteraceae bacterium]